MLWRHSSSGTTIRPRPAQDRSRSSARFNRHPRRLHRLSCTRSRPSRRRLNRCRQCSKSQTPVEIQPAVIASEIADTKAESETREVAVDREVSFGPRRTITATEEPEPVTQSKRPRSTAHGSPPQWLYSPWRPRCSPGRDTSRPQPRRPRLGRWSSIRTRRAPRSSLTTCRVARRR